MTKISLRFQEYSLAPAMIVIFRGFAVHYLLEISNAVLIRVSANGDTFCGIILDELNRFFYGVLSVTTDIVANIPTVHVEVLNDLVVDVFNLSFGSLLLTLLVIFLH